MKIRKKRKTKTKKKERRRKTRMKKTWKAKRKNDILHTGKNRQNTALKTVGNIELP